MSPLQKLLEQSSLHDVCGTAAQRARLKATLTSTPTTRQVDGDLKLSEGQDLLFEEGRVHVKGHLILEDPSRLLVAGDLVVEGNIVNEGFDYALLFVGGALTARNLLFHGEVVSLGSIAVKGVAWTYYNDHSTYADLLTARVVVADDRADAVDVVRADRHLVGHSSQITEALGKVLHAQAWDAHKAGAYPDLAMRLCQGKELLREG
ncbi:hypothetical protein [Corallococcus llansteffanensis]|uniref:Polymer-forming cytoskeletal protein n=1 Tax=Corallococcus llansteffanensis TaxID=2316731 RepID=A0A3A8QAD9_9BACT|nr:hypothetical protein [Corallococcus llansteffanensis]RKH63195.1 hypothetical protein D7V93_09105 [Corallococcus llansteffanensis]